MKNGYTIILLITTLIIIIVSSMGCIFKPEDEANWGYYENYEYQYRIEITNAQKSNYILYVPLLVNHKNQRLEINNKIRLIKGNCTYNTVDFPKGPAFKIISNETIVLEINETFSYKPDFFNHSIMLTNFQMSMEYISESSGRTYENYWVYFETTDDSSISLLLYQYMFWHIEENGRLKFSGEGLYESNTKLSNGWQIISGLREGVVT